MRGYIILLATTALVYFGAMICSALEWFPQPSLALPTVVFFLVLTVVIYRKIIAAPTREDMVKVYLASIIIKLVAAFGYLLAIALMGIHDLAANGVLLIVCYLAFTTAEVYVLYAQKR